MDISSQKQQARASIAERLAKLDTPSRAAESRSVCRRIREELPGESLKICAYNPMRTEVNIMPLLQELIAEGHTIALPHTEGRGFAFRIPSSIDHLATGPFNVGEPKMNDPKLDLKDVDVVLLPGIAFDGQGNRLGRGNGGYDKFLSDLRAVNTRAEVWGICYDCQMLRTVPTEAHDAKVDAVVTARGVARVLS